MLRDRSISEFALRAALLPIVASLAGCFAISRGERDIDRTPIVDTGVGASIIYPGQTVPLTPRSGSVVIPQAPAPGPPAQAVPGSPGAAPSAAGAPAPSSGLGEQQSSGSPPGTPMTMIGGAKTEETRHEAWKQEPAWLKYMTLPFAFVAAPFKAIAGAVRDEPEAGPELPRSEPSPVSPAPPPPRVDYETTMVERMEQELEQRHHAAETAPDPASAGAGPDPAVARAAGSRPPPLSIADELAALQRSPSAAPPTRSGAGATGATSPLPAPGATSPPPRPRATPGRTADGIVDRDGDGRVDEWIFRDNGEITRVELDENADGRPDRILHYDLASHQITRVEEDANADGASDSWTDYREGHVLRRRADADYDGVVDTWSFYRDGEITRHEQDTTGDGYRDRAGFYVKGKLVREEQDRDGDGRPDVAVHYDSRERVARREEDTDGDGRFDVISYYDAGRLSRRELLEYDDGASGRP